MARYMKYGGRGVGYLVPIPFFCYTYFEVIKLPRNPRDVSKSGVWCDKRGIRPANRCQ